MRPHEKEALSVCIANLDKIGTYRDKPIDGNPTRGKCYLASAALHEFLGGAKAGYHLTKAIDKNGDHYWVTTDQGSILDPTKAQFDLMNEAPPYRKGKNVGRRNNLKKHLPLLEAMKKVLVDNIERQIILKDIVGRPKVFQKNEILTEEHQEILSTAWRVLVAEWASRPEEFIKCFFTKGQLAVYFVRAMLYREEIPRTATMAYTWERFYVAGNNYPLSDLLPAALERPRFLKGLRYVMQEDLTFDRLFKTHLPINGHRVPADFPISLARDLINKYCPKGGDVLDPCHGWGGRLVGFMLSHAVRYVGVDPAPHSPKLREMFDDLSQFLFEPKKLTLINKPFEDVSLRESAYDFAFTSPPYFNLQKYQGEQSSWRRYKTLNEWINGFFKGMLLGVAYALKPGAFFALQITPKFDLVSVAQKIGAEVGLDYLHIFDTAMRRYNGVMVGESTTELIEVVIVFRRC